MSSISYSEPGSDKVGRTNGSGTRLAAERASSQATRPGLKVSVKRLESIGRNLLLAIGEDPTREGLRMTPNRFARWWKEFIDYDPARSKLHLHSSRFGPTRWSSVLESLFSVRAPPASLQVRNFHGLYRNRARSRAFEVCSHRTQIFTPAASAGTAGSSNR
jgi:GTP cyclohydrolase I